MRLRHVAPVLLAVSLVAGCLAEFGEEEDEVGEIDQELRGALLAPRSRPQVGQVFFDSDGGNCTATLITRGALLTAAHCVPWASSKPDGIRNGRWETLGRDGKKASYDIDGWRTLDYACGRDWWSCDKTRDIAVVYLWGDPATWGVPKSVAKPARIRTSRPPDLTGLTQYGFGYSSSGCTSGAGQKRRNWFYLGSRPHTGCRGDSGGPVFTPDGRIFVIHSGTDAGGGNVYAHPYAYTSWIYSNIAYASSGDYTPPWISSVSVGFYPTRLDVAVSDDDGVDFVDYFVDGGFAGFAENGPTYTSTAGLPGSGWHTVTAVAYDYEGNPRTYQASIDFTAPACNSAVLWPGQAWVSANGQYRMTFQADGNVVLRSPDGVARWHTNTLNYPGRTASHFKLECNGDLALYDTAGATWWHSNTAGSGATSFVVQDDCNAVLYDANHAPRWSTGTYDCMATPPPNPSCGGLPSGGVLGTDQTMPSCDGRFRLTMQLDGNLVLYQGSTPIWASNTYGSGGGNRAVMQQDGNFVVYTSDGRAVWASSSSFGYNGATLSVQNDGNMVIYSTGGAPVWHSNTCCR